MTDTFRALCAELAKQLEGWQCFARSDGPNADVLARARAALAQPEPQGPTDEDILALSQWHEVSYTLSDGTVVYPMQEGTDMKDSVLSFARAVLARWGTPTNTINQEDYECQRIRRDLLAPAARAVLWAGLNRDSDRLVIASALQAAADKIRFQDQLGLTAYGGFAQAQNQFLAIAAELEGGND